MELSNRNILCMLYTGKASCSIPWFSKRHLLPVRRLGALLLYGPRWAPTVPQILDSNGRIHRLRINNCTNWLGNYPTELVEHLLVTQQERWDCRVRLLNITGSCQGTAMGSTSFPWSSHRLLKTSFRLFQSMVGAFFCDRFWWARSLAAARDKLRSSVSMLGMGLEAGAGMES